MGWRTTPKTPFRITSGCSRSVPNTMCKPAAAKYPETGNIMSARPICTPSGINSDTKVVYSRKNESPIQTLRNIARRTSWPRSPKGCSPIGSALPWSHALFNLYLRNISFYRRCVIEPIPEEFLDSNQLNLELPAKPPIYGNSFFHHFIDHPKQIVPYLFQVGEPDVDHRLFRLEVGSPEERPGRDTAD